MEELLNLVVGVLALCFCFFLAENQYHVFLASLNQYVKKFTLGCSFNSDDVH